MNSLPSRNYNLVVAIYGQPVSGSGRVAELVERLRLSVYNIQIVFMLPILCRLQYGVVANTFTAPDATRLDKFRRVGSGGVNWA